MHNEIKPTKTLCDIVESFWTTQTDSTSKEHIIQVLPDGCFDIVIYINQAKKNKVLITGIWDKPIPVEVHKNSNVIGARFYPACIDLLFNTNLSNIKNLCVPLEEEMTNKIDGLTLELLYSSKEQQEIIDFFEVYLCMLLKTKDHQPNYVLNKIRNTDTSRPIADISKSIGISDRHLTREFNKMFGIRTKTYLNILRFIKAKDMLSSKPINPLLDIALACDYYDQAHFIKEFKKYSGLTPKQYILVNV